MSEGTSSFVKLASAVVIIIGVMTIITSIVGTTSNVRHCDDVRKAIDAGYVCYYDGELVDGSKLVLSNFKAEINHEERTVLLTKKVYLRGYSYSPVYVPALR